MPRVARIVAPGFPHHVTQRGNRREPVFFEDADRQAYLMLLMEYKDKYGLSIWSHCLMTDHVHFVVAPQAADSLARTMRDTHQAYSSWLNRRLGQSGLRSILGRARPPDAADGMTRCWRPIGRREGRRPTGQRGFPTTSQSSKWKPSAAGR